MKNRKLLTIAAVAGLAIGGLSVASAASAQSYGSEQDDATEETSDSTLEVEAPDDGATVLVQDVDESETDDAVPGETEERQRRGRRGHRGGCNLEEAATAIGIEEADLRAAIESGDSIADVAEANGVDVDVVIDAMVDAKAERIAEKVSEGRITQEQADEKLADLEAKITDRVNGEEGAPDA